MENCLTANPDINVVYTINEPAAFGANTALKAAGTAENVDRRLRRRRLRRRHAASKTARIDATSQQYPLKMASMGVDAVADYIARPARRSPATPTPASR